MLVAVTGINTIIQCPSWLYIYCIYILDLSVSDRVTSRVGLALGVSEVESYVITPAFHDTYLANFSNCPVAITDFMDSVL